MDNFGKFQPHQNADDKSCESFWHVISQFFKSFWGPFNNAFVVSFKLRFLKLNLLCLVDKWSGYSLHIKKNKFYRYNYT